MGRRSDRSLDERTLHRADWEDLTPNARAAIRALALHWANDIQAMADDLGIGRQAIYTWIAGTVSPSGRTIEKIKDVTGIVYDDLMLVDTAAIYVGGQRLKVTGETRKIVESILRGVISDNDPKLAKKLGWESDD